MENDDQGIAAKWMDLLGEEGYRPHHEVNEEDTARCRVAFKVEGLRYYLYLDEKDPTFFFLSLSYVLGDLPDEPELLLEAAGAATRQLKGTKVWVDQEARAVYSNYEWFAEELPSSKLLERLLSQVSNGADTFFEKAREMAKPVEVE